MNLVRDDQIYLRSFADMAVVRMPHTLRRAFVTLIRTNLIVDGRPFWPHFADDIARDYFNHFPAKTQNERHQMVLHYINNSLARFGRNNLIIGLPMPDDDDNIPPPDDPAPVISAPAPRL